MPPRTIPMSPTSNHQTQPSSILSRIRPIEEINTNRLKCSFYGDIGTGKTRLASSFPKPILLIAAEIGTDSITGIPGIDVAPITGGQDFWAALDHAISGKSQWGVSDSHGNAWKFLGIGQFRGESYKTVVLDTATKLRKITIDEKWRAKGKDTPASKPPEFAGKEWKDVWGDTSQDMQKMLGRFISLPDSNDLCVVVNSHEANLTFTPEEPSESTSQFLKPNVSSAIGKSVAEFLNAEASYVGQMLIRDKYEDRIEKLGDLENKSRVRVGSEYVMRVGPDAIYRTKFRRSPMITTPLPDYVPNPTYQEIVKLIKGEM